MQSGITRQVLLVDDNDTDALIVEHFLKASAGPAGTRYDVTRVDNIEAGLAVLEEALPDVLLLDLHFPGSIGSVTFGRFEAYAAQVPIVLLTASDDDDLSYRLVERGGQDFLRKEHVNRWSLVHAIEFACNRHEIQSQMRELLVAASGAGRDFQSLVQATPSPLIVTDVDFKLQFANPAGCFMLSAELDDLIGTDLDLFRDQDSGQALMLVGDEQVAVDASSIRWDGAEAILLTVQSGVSAFELSPGSVIRN